MFGALKIRSYLTLALFIVGAYSPLLGQPECFLDGNEAYSNKNYPEAIALWEKCLAEGSESAQLYYNLGNAYLQQEVYARAILHYEKAKEIDEVDGLEENLGLARLQLEDEIPAFSDFFLIKIYRWLMSCMHPNIWVVLSVLSLLGLLWLLYERWSKEKHSVAILVGMAVMTLFTLVMAFQTSAYHSGMQYGIMMVKSDLHSGSDDRSEKIRGVGFGNKVRLLDSLGTWIKVELPDKERGWVQMENLERI